MFYPVTAVSDPVAMQASHQASSEARRASSKVECMEFNIERLLMITEALWTMLKEQHGYTDAELQMRVAEIDMRDGKLDGRIAPTEAPKCSQCGRSLSKKRPRCLYCGHVAPPSLFER